jgi:hypothetical protein
MDPVSIIGVATTAFKGLKAAVEAGRELQDCVSQLSQWAGAIADLDKLDELNKKKKSSLFTSLVPKSGKSVEQEAVEIFAAKKQAQAQKSELLQFIGYSYGEKGLREFVDMEKQVRAERRKTAYAELERIQKLKDLGAAAFLVLLSVATLGLLLALVLAIKEAK